MTYTSGIDYITPDKPFDEPAKCAACTSVMDGEWAHGPTGFAEATAKRGHKHYRYKCPHVEREGHDVIVKLLEEVSQFTAPSLQALVRSDLYQARVAFLATLAKEKEA